MAPQLQEALILRKEVQKACGIARSTLWLRIKQGTFPAPVKIGPRARAWTVSSISAWIEKQVAASTRGAS